MLLVMLCGATGGCATSDICNIRYFKPSIKDTAETQSQALAQNLLLKEQGCPEDNSGRSPFKFLQPK
jgi:hypothetical protein